MLSANEDYFLSTYFQTKIEESEYFSNLPSDETRPYDNKYKARKVLEELIATKNIEDLSAENKAITKGIIEYLLGLNFFDTEENSMADKHFLAALEHFSQMKKERIFYFFNYIQDLYNSLGILYTNREEIENGLGLFAKAESLYSFMKKIYSKNPVSVVNNIKHHYKPSKDAQIQFRFYHQGGINLNRCEKSYTLTLFYMAQAYAKIGIKSKAAQYCGWTLKRQFETKDYDMKEWAVNCLGLAEFYNANFEFAQSQYLLMAGLSILPEDSKKKLHATFYMALGHHLLEFLAFAVEKYLGGQQEESTTVDTLNKSAIILSGINVEFKKLSLPKTKDEVNSIFRQMNTQFKKALKYYELDGYVTEYIEIVRDLSKGYRYLMLIEEDGERSMALLERRRELIEYPAKEINPKAYEFYWQQLCLELGEIFNHMLDYRFDQFMKGEPKMKKSAIEQMNKYCVSSIDYYEKVIGSVVNGTNKEALENQETLKTLITAKFSVAKNYSRWQGKNVGERVNTLKKSMESYKWIRDFINEHMASKGALSYEMRETLKNCEEMVQLLPAKIDRVNYEG